MSNAGPPVAAQVNGGGVDDARVNPQHIILDKHIDLPDGHVVAVELVDTHDVTTVRLNTSNPDRGFGERRVPDDTRAPVPLTASRRPSLERTNVGRLVSGVIKEHLTVILLVEEVPDFTVDARYDVHLKELVLNLNNRQLGGLAVARPLVLGEVRQLRRAHVLHTTLKDIGAI